MEYEFHWKQLCQKFLFSIFWDKSFTHKNPVQVFKALALASFCFVSGLAEHKYFIFYREHILSRDMKWPNVKTQSNVNKDLLDSRAYVASWIVASSKLCFSLITTDTDAMKRGIVSISICRSRFTGVKGVRSLSTGAGPDQVLPASDHRAWEAQTPVKLRITQAGEFSVIKLIQ